MQNRLQRLITSVLNQHNIWVIALIVTSISISLLPYYSSSPSPTEPNLTNVIILESVTPANLTQLYADYQKLNASFHYLRAKLVVLEASSSVVRLQHVIHNQSLEKAAVLSKQHEDLLKRMDIVEKAAAAQSLPKPSFQDQRLLTDLFTKIHNIEITTKSTASRLNSIKRYHNKALLLARVAKSAIQHRQSMVERRSVMRTPASAMCTVDSARLKQMIEQELKSQLRSAETHQQVDTTTFDFALQSAGAEPVTTLTSATYLPQSALSLKAVTAHFMGALGLDRSLLENTADGLFGSPWDALTTVSTPGSCWPMKGSFGNLTIQLEHPVHITAVSIDHISRHEVQDTRSAPKSFSVFTSDSLTNAWRLLLTGRYDLLSHVTQTFHAPSEFEISAPSSFVRLEIHDNYGHPDYTCLYRFRVHGGFSS